MLVQNGFATRDDAVKSLKSIVASLNDPYSKYLTREELRMELEAGSDGFLGLGALVESSASRSTSSTRTFDMQKTASFTSALKDFDRAASRPLQGGVATSLSLNQQFAVPMSSSKITGKPNSFLSVDQAANLPVITAIVPDSPAERAGLVVGDRIASVGDYQFTGMSQTQVQKALSQHFHADNYFGRADLTVAKQVTTSSPLGPGSSNAHYDENGNVVEEKYVFENGWYQVKNSRQGMFDVPSEQLLGYKLSRAKSIPTTLTAKLVDSPASTVSTSGQNKFPSVVGGDNIVHFELLTPNDSIFQHIDNAGVSRPVGYIRLTRFSAASTSGYINAINSLEEAGAQSYIIDLRNNYGGVIQEA